MTNPNGLATKRPAHIGTYALAEGQRRSVPCSGSALLPIDGLRAVGGQRERGVEGVSGDTELTLFGPSSCRPPIAS